MIDTNREIKGYSNIIDYAYKKEKEIINKSRKRGILLLTAGLGGAVIGLATMATVATMHILGAAIAGSSLIISTVLLAFNESKKTHKLTELKKVINKVKLNEKAQDLNKEDKELIKELVKKKELVKITSIGLNANLLENDYELIKKAAYTPKVAEYINETNKLDAFDILDEETLGNPFTVIKQEKKQKTKKLNK